MSKIKEGESQNIEYKESWRDEYLKWICGFANASGGRMYIGVNDDKEIVGVANSKRLMEVLRAKYLVSPVRFEGMQRIEELEVPIVALREILYNSVTHKDYAGPDIQMHVYNDHVEIWNEGELPMGYDERVLYGKHSSKPRNRNIADTMFKAGFIDTWGRGYSKISDGFKAAGLPVPSVKSHCGGTLVSFMRGFDVVNGKRIGGSDVGSDVGSSVGSNAKDATSHVTSLSPVQLNEKQRVICELIRNNPKISVREMSLAMSLVERTIKRHLAAMQKKGILIREGNTSAGRWVLLIKD